MSVDTGTAIGLRLGRFPSDLYLGRATTARRRRVSEWSTSEIDDKFAALNLQFYRTQIQPKHLRALLEFIGREEASADFNPEEIFYPDDI